jgi:Immunoglobulin-like domain of bacterial spore germination
MKITKIIAIVLGIVVVVLLGVLIFVPTAKGPATSSMPSGQSAPSPGATVSADGHLRIDLPDANDVISSPVAIEGTVTGGGWFFEGSFPIKVLDADGAIIGQGTAQALSDWISTGTVPFSASITFTAPHYASGTILFENDNPSGAPQNARSLSVPVRF